MTTNEQVEKRQIDREAGNVREWITLREMQELLGIGSTKAYELVTSGEVPSVRIGRAIRISRRALASWLEQQTYTTQK